MSRLNPSFALASVLNHTISAAFALMGHCRKLQQQKTFRYPWLVLLVVMPASVFASVTATIDRNPIHVNETFTLEIHSDNTDADAPDLKQLPAGLTILRRNNVSSRSIINGKITSEQRWVYKISAKQTGDIVIPAIKVGDELTTALTLHVDANNTRSNESTDRPQKVLLRTEVDKKTIYLQQQLTYTVKLYHAVSLHSAQLSDVQVPDALVQSLGQDIQYQTTLNNQPYYVVERKYALFPQKAGELTIGPVEFNGEIASNTQSGLFGQFDDTEPLQLQSTPVTVQVLPAAQTGSWLPTPKAQIDAVISPTQNLHAGEPVTLTLTTKIDAQVAANVMPMNFSDNSDWRFYPDNAKDELQSGADGLHLVRTQKVALIPVHAGTLKAPELRLNWWNTLTDKAEVSSVDLPALSIQEAINKPVVAITTNPEKIGTNVNSKNTTSIPGAANTTSVVVDNARPWQWSTLIFALLWLLTLAYAFMRRQTPEHGAGQNKNPGKSSFTTPASESGLRKQLETACRQNDAMNAHHLMLEWLRVLTQENTLAWTDIRHRCTAYEVILAELDSAAFSADQHSWTGHTLLRALNDIAKLMPNKNKTSKAVLPPLNPE